MKISALFRILGFVMVGGLAGLAFWSLRLGLFGLFGALEGLALFAIIYLVFFHRRIIKPLHIIGDGMDLLREQDFSTRLKEVGQPEADRIIQIFNKMIEQLKEERLKVREQNQFLDLLINASPLGVIILDFDDRVYSVNNAAITLLAHDKSVPLIGKRFGETDNELLHSMLQIEPYSSQTIRQSDASIYKCTHSRFIDRGFHHSFYLIELLTEEVFKAEKKAYGQVIRMIAHEVNNTTAGVISTLDTIGQAFDDVNSDIHNVLQVTIERCYRMNRFISNYAEVVRIPEPQCIAHNINDLMTSCKRFMEMICREKNISIELEMSEIPPFAPIDAVLFEQAVVNIIKNAAEAIGSDGKIIISTSADPVAIEIANTGKGIDRETESKLFTPFFSTKPNGQGLGLLFIREVLKKHNCSFSLKTCPDGLTRFNIEF
ncbi:MAG: HAMP domain-containing protein [Tannerella sp.]|jgi:nitrogen fixation/metabolism regulation signal transduction histidine kinase|nr:HAMP domain-containing protein [Tannerella sp.]